MRSTSSAARPFEPRDAEAARALIGRALEGTPYAPRTVELLEEVLEGSEETFGAVLPTDHALEALALYGPVAGSVAWRIDALIFATNVPVRDVGGALLDFIAAQTRKAGRALLVAELPADPVMGRSLTLLRVHGFRQEGRIPDYYRDGVALLFFRRDL